MLADVCAAIIERVRTLPDVVQVPDFPPAQLVDDPMVIVYGNAGISTPAAHRGRDGAPVYQHADAVAIEYYTKANPDEMGAAYPRALAALDACRATVAREFDRDGFGGLVLGILSLDGSGPKDMGRYGSDSTFGWQIIVNLTHRTAVQRDAP